MNAAPEFNLETYSQAISHLITGAGDVVVAVKPAAYRVTSGVIFRDDLIAVNNHALRREGMIPMHLPDGSEAEASILGRDPSVDVAILKVAGAKLKCVSPESESHQRPGELAVVVGRTIDVGLSASIGILGAVGGARRTWRRGQLDRFLRLDVNLYPSQAGAAVVSARGLFLGMATPAMLRHSALAIPYETLNRVADELLQEGRIRQGYLGVGLQPVRIPERLQSKSPLVGESGLMVLNVEPGTSAEEAGLQLGDILIAAGPVVLSETEALLAALRGDAVNKPMNFTVLRAGEIVEVEVQIALRDDRS